MLSRQVLIEAIELSECSTGENNYPDLYVSQSLIPVSQLKPFAMRLLLLTGKPLRRELTTPKEQADATRREQEATRAP